MEYIQKLISSFTPWSAKYQDPSQSRSSKVVPIQNDYVRKGGITQLKIYGIASKFNHFIYTLVCNYMPNIRILAKAVLQIFCSQGCSYTKRLCLKKESNSTENLRNSFKR